MLILYNSAYLCAQSGGSIHGLILNPSGEPVGDAKLALHRPAGDTALREARSNSKGQFAIVDVPPDYYDLVVEAQGLNRTTIRTIKVEPGRPIVIAPVQLQMGEIEQPTTPGRSDSQPTADRFAATGVARVYPAGLGSSVEIRNVTSAQESLQSIGAEISSTVTREQVQGLPVLDRDPMALILTQAGVINGRSSEGNFFTVVNGLRPSYANMSFDGVNIQRNYVRANALESDSNRLFLDQISEFTVITGNAPATFGGGAAQVALVSPPGTNRMHGSGFWMHRNDALKANGWLFNSRGTRQTPFSQNQAGGSLAGPIFKDKLLFYVNFEAFARREQVPDTRIIPTATARQGIIRYNDGAGGIQAFNPFTSGESRLDPVIQQILSLIPGPEKINDAGSGDGLNTGGYTFPVRNNVDRDHVTSKLDWNPSPSHALGVTFLWMAERRDRAELSNNYGAIPVVYNDNNRRIGTAYWRWNPTGRTTNEVRAGFNLLPVNFFLHPEPAVPLASTTLFTSPVNDPFTNNNLRPQSRTDDTYTLQESFTANIGSHTLQAGWQMQRFRSRIYDEINVLPAYSLYFERSSPDIPNFPGGRNVDFSTAVNIWAGLAGRVQRITQRFNTPAGGSDVVPGAPLTGKLRLNQSAVYAHDVWKLHRRLTISMGLRYEVPGVPEEVNGRMLSPRLINGDPVRTLYSDAVLDFIGGNTGRLWYAPDRNNFAPQLGLAWDVTGSRKWLFRAGYSLHYVNDETVRAAESVLERNPGLKQYQSKLLPAPALLSAPPALTPLNLRPPLPFSQAALLDTVPVFGVLDPNLRTPYVQEWAAALEHEWRNLVTTFRYVGNHAVGSVVDLDLNQPDLTKLGFLDDFRRAERNFALSGQTNPDPLCSGCEPLRLFAGLSGAGFTNLVRTGQAGELAYQLRSALSVYPTRLADSAVLLGNGAASSYHALQVEARRRFRRGLQVQANYTFSKVLSNSGDSSLKENRLERPEDVFNTRLGRARAPFDISHALKANWIYQLPLARIGGASSAFVRALLGGWSTSGILVWHSGAPYSLLSGFGTFNRVGQSSHNTVNTNLTKSQLEDRLDFKVDGFGALVGSGFQRGDLSNPSSGTVGMLQQRMFSGPWFFNVDLAVLKSTRVRESQEIEFRCEAVNAINHNNWIVSNQVINLRSFGRGAAPFGNARELQIGLIYRF